MGGSRVEAHVAEAKRILAVVAALAAFVLLSSLLGLSGRFLVSDPGAALRFMGGIWMDSAFADVVFVATTCAAAILAFRASRDSILIGGALAALLNWLAYLLSFLSLPSGTTSGLGASDVLHAIQFVGIWGLVGLVFCTLAVPLAALWWRRREGAPSASLKTDSTLDGA
jgi:hypothetical protein